jgi:leucyl-tRNA synthetase
LTKEVFDYVFFGKGTIQDVVVKSKISAAELKAMREEFLYWYPVDLRVSAKELVPNHLTFFIFHHVALFPKEHWPKAIGVNGMLMIEGKQMHKSKGNFVTAKNAIEQHGADATRCALLLAAEGMDDPDWRSSNVKDTCSKIESFYSFAKNMIQNASAEDKGDLEKWLMSTMQRRVEQVTENLEQMKTRTALEIAFFEVWNDFRWYMRRKGHTISVVLKDALEIWLKLLAPFAPHICEETWSLLSKKGFISTASWPKSDTKQVNVKIEESENFIKTVVEDTQSVIRATRTTPTKIHYYVSAPWKWRLHLAILEKSVQGKPEHGILIKELLNQPALKEHAKEVAALAPKFAEEITKMPPERRDTHLTIGTLNEEEILRNAEQFLVDEFKAHVHVLRETTAEKYDPKQRAKLARPHRPAIYIE